MIMRLQKYMSESWICSRRKAEEYIVSWLVKINWKTADLWQSINPEIDEIKFLDQVIEEQKKFVYYKINKPRGIETTCAQNWKSSIMDIIDTKERVFPVWRLDKDTIWLLILTNDGRLANYLMHPKYEHEKEYVVETFWPISDNQLEDLEEGIFILWKKTKKAIIRRISSWKFSIIITEWRNRQIRRMAEKIWAKVKKLKRIRIENIEIWNLNLWEYKKLSHKEKNTLFKKLWINMF